MMHKCFSQTFKREHLKHGTPEPEMKGGYGTFADLEGSMCRRDPRFGTVLLLGNTPRGFWTHGHTPSGKLSGARGNLKNLKFRKSAEFLKSLTILEAFGLHNFFHLV